MVQQIDVQFVPKDIGLSRFLENLREVWKSTMFASLVLIKTVSTVKNTMAIVKNARTGTLFRQAKRSVFHAEMEIMRTTPVRGIVKFAIQDSSGTTE